MANVDSVEEEPLDYDEYVVFDEFSEQDLDIDSILDGDETEKNEEIFVESKKVSIIRDGKNEIAYLFFIF